MIKFRLFVYFFVSSLFFTHGALFSSPWNAEMRWDWNHINLEDTFFWDSLSFKPGFVWGAATSAKQIEGVETYDNQFVENNWTIDSILGDAYKNNPGTGHWDKYKEDVQLIKNMGLNAYRFSIAWEKIEPEEGKYDQKAMDHYKDLCRELKNNGIDPWVCLFHFTTPVWFAEKGGFKNESNIYDFINFCVFVFDNLKEYVTFWATYNEPTAYAMEGYFEGKYPPHEKNIISAGTVLLNLLKGHVIFYQLVKRKNPSAQIGIIHMFHLLDSKNPNNPAERIIVKVANHLMHDIVVKFFKNGSFNWLYLVRENNKLATRSLDFIGVNYYCHEIMQISLFGGIKRLQARPDELCAPDNGKSVYPEGLYRAIVQAAQLSLPLYVTENGIADRSDTMRNEYIKKHIFAVQKAINDGYEVRGYFCWSLMDTLGWKKDYHSTYGLYAVDFETKERALREGAKEFQKYLLKKNLLIA